MDIFLTLDLVGTASTASANLPAAAAEAFAAHWRRRWRPAAAAATAAIQCAVGLPAAASTAAAARGLLQPAHDIGGTQRWWHRARTHFDW